VWLSPQRRVLLSRRRQGGHGRLRQLPLHGRSNSSQTASVILPTGGNKHVLRLAAAVCHCEYTVFGLEAAAAVTAAAQTAAAITAATARATSTALSEPWFSAARRVPLPPGSVLAHAAATNGAKATAASALSAADCVGGCSDGYDCGGGGCGHRRRQGARAVRAAATAKERQTHLSASHRRRRCSNEGCAAVRWHADAGALPSTRDMSAKSSYD